MQGVVEFQTDEKFGKSIMQKFDAKKIKAVFEGKLLVRESLVPTKTRTRTLG